MSCLSHTNVLLSSSFCRPVSKVVISDCDCGEGDDDDVHGRE